MGAEVPTEGIRRVVTGHDATGRAVVISDDVLDAVTNPNGSAKFTLVWTTAGSPVDNDDATDGRERATGLTLPGGSVIRVVEILPGRDAPMHRTDSLDYGIVLDGSIELVLDDDAVTLVEAGQIIVQRGTIHAWRNPSTEKPVRVAFVLLDAKPVTVDGAPLPAIAPGDTRPNT